MSITEKYYWFSAVIIAGVLYLLVGILLPNPSASDPTQFMWRLAAWIISAVIFCFHFLYEHFWFHNSPRRTALHVSLGVALGALGLAIAANIHAIQTGVGNRNLLTLAIVIWPIMTGIPAFAAAYVAALVITKIKLKGKWKSI